MFSSRLSLILIHILGGSSVLVSYALWLFVLSFDGAALWGGVPSALQPLYTSNMFLAAGGYFMFATLLLFRYPMEPIGRLDHSTLHLVSVCILFPSAFWLPLTAAYVAHPNLWIWVAIRASLFLVGGGSLVLMWVIYQIPKEQFLWHRRLALVGGFFLTFQTFLLDALIWPAFFPIAH